MSYYALIYSPDGDPFEVPHDRAAELVLNQGWTRQIVHKTEPIKAERAQPVRQIATLAMPAEADAPDAPDKPH